MNVSYASEARLELLQAAAYYEEAKAGLGRDFLREIRDAVKVVTAHPLRWPLRTGRARQYRLNRFPYALIYRLQARRLRIVAIADLRRKPGYWRRRE